jgi:hypothetical protein
MATIRRHRWPGEHPPDPGPLEHPLPPLAHGAQRTPEDLYEAMGDLAGAIRSMVPIVLSSETWALDASGQASREYRVPFRSIAVWSFSAQRLTLTDAPKQTAAPPAGPGVAIIPINGFKLSNLASHAWSIYGGTAGDLICVETYGLPMPPAAAKLV